MISDMFPFPGMLKRYFPEPAEADDDDEDEAEIPDEDGE